MNPLISFVAFDERSLYAFNAFADVLENEEAYRTDFYIPPDLKKRATDKGIKNINVIVYDRNSNQRCHIGALNLAQKIKDKSAIVITDMGNIFQAYLHEHLNQNFPDVQNLAYYDSEKTILDNSMGLNHVSTLEQILSKSKAVLFAYAATSKENILRKKTIFNLSITQHSYEQILIKEKVALGFINSLKEEATAEWQENLLWTINKYADINSRTAVFEKELLPKHSHSPQKKRKEGKKLSISPIKTNRQNPIGVYEKREISKKYILLLCIIIGVGMLIKTICHNPTPYFLDIME